MDRVIAFIPARGSSKSIPHKNIKSIAGKSLIQWSIDAAFNSGIVDSIIVSTESDEVKQTVRSANPANIAIHNRSLATATDTASTESVILEFLDNHSGFKISPDDILILLQPTSPQTTSLDIAKALEQYRNTSCDSLVSCTRSKRFFWSESGTPQNYDPTNRPRRQDFRGTLQENGAIYISRIKNIQKSRCRVSGRISMFVMDTASSFEIDEPDDWIILEQILRKQNRDKPSEIPKLILSDVDGVLTDGSMYYSEQGDELKRFSTYDGVAFRLFKERGIRTGILTGETTQIVTRRAEKMGVDYVRQGISGPQKLAAALEICNDLNILLSETLYIGDDINCKELLEHVGSPFCPKSAQQEITAIKGIYALSTNGGCGCIREVYNKIFPNI